MNSDFLVGAAFVVSFALIFVDDISAPAALILLVIDCCLFILMLTHHYQTNRQELLKLKNKSDELLLDLTQMHTQHIRVAKKKKAVVKKRRSLKNR